MAYATSSDLRKRYGSAWGSYLDQDPDAVGTALEDAEVEVNSYVGGAYTLPLPEVPVLLMQICCDIAIYRLQPLRREEDIEDARRRYEDAVRRLKAIRDGSLDLGLPPASAPRGVEAPILVTANRRLFSRDSLREA